MYDYKFIKLNMSWGFSREPKEDYHEIINKQGKDGWRLVQIFSPAIGGYGRSTFYELIFEKEIK